ncbi:DUF1289 domain-containing protein [Paraburkholderia flava]|uniref:DUF1289 domain-containing protein n=1 Tax=Paraburkholderia flava TaxID=2547393 RepID=UPI00106202C4|nr:DUF1289 domain-containing protein [Paraburkholderia flava]
MTDTPRSDPRDVTPVPSPCIDVCRMNPSTGWCDGCLRTIDEIANWSSFDDAHKRTVWDAIELRHAQEIARLRERT